MLKVQIVKDGPYIVSGAGDFIEETSEVRNHILQAITTKTLKLDGEAHLCRCGGSANKPFCDGTHVKIEFDGTETADTTDYVDRAEMFEGEDMDLLDDNRCSFARFCHRQKGEVWTLTQYSGNSENKREAIEGACACPSGRLTAVVDGELVEQKYKPTISIAQDPMRNVSAGIYLRGEFSLVSGDGISYEKRNRVSLCRCGNSSNKPFCDATHVEIDFNDKF